MQISKMRIDRFGAWTDLELGDLSPELSVVYGPTGAGKRTVAKFLRSVLFGFSDETRKRFVSAESFGIGGSLVVDNRRAERTIRRHADGIRGDRLVVEDQHGSVIGKHHVHDLTGRILPSVFDRMFQPRRKQGSDIDVLIEAAIAQGFDMVGGHGDATQLEILQQKLRDATRAQAELTAGEASLSELTDRKHRVELEIEALTISVERERSARSERLQRLAIEVQELETELVELRHELDSLDAEIEARESDRRMWDERVRQMRREKELAMAEYREQLEEIDQQLARWHAVLQDLDRRSTELNQNKDSAELADRAFVGDPRRFLGRIENQLDGLQQVTAEFSETPNDSSCQCRELRVVLEPVLRSLRDDVYRLCNELSQWEVKSLQSETHHEMDQLERCESELRLAMKGLSLRRQELLAKLSELQDGSFRSIEMNHARQCQCTEHPNGLEAVTFVSKTPELDEEHLALLKVEIDRLLERRNGVLQDIDMVQQTLKEDRDQQNRARLASDDQSERLAARQLELEHILALIHQASRRAELTETIAKLESEIRVLQAAVRQPQLLCEASDLLNRLTRGRWTRISVASDRRVCVHDRGDRRQMAGQLEANASDRVYLSLCLALAAAYARQQTRLPMILDDRLIDGDQAEREAAVAVLHGFAKQGHQLFVFTQHRSIAGLFRAADVRVFELPEHTVVKTIQPEPEPVVVRHVERDLSEVNRKLYTIAEETVTPTAELDRPAWDGEEFPGELTDRVTMTKKEDVLNPPVDIVRCDADYFLSESSPIQEAPSIDSATAERFRKIGVLLVRDLLRVDTAKAATQLRHAGITASMIRRWRSEALLVCRIPRLRPYDARILVESGVSDPQQLATLDAQVLRKRVEAFARTSKGQTLIQAGDRYELSRLTDWINASRSRSGSGFLERRSEGAQSSQAVFDNRTLNPQRPPLVDKSKRRWASESSSKESSDSSSKATSQREPMVLKMEQADAEDGELRFYLSTSDPLEAAPSIGPQTAERFEAIGVFSVADFLNGDPETMALQLDHRRINAATIIDWQKQAVLVCRTPFLRGHDAQLLVACEITDADVLARMSSAALWSKIGPFSETQEGKRIIRNGKAPDLAEIKDWISWATQARQLRAA